MVPINPKWRLKYNAEETENSTRQKHAWLPLKQDH